MRRKDAWCHWCVQGAFVGGFEGVVIVGLLFCLFRFPFVVIPSTLCGGFGHLKMDEGFVDKGAAMELPIANGGNGCERGITIKEHALSCWSFIETRGGWYDESRWMGWR